MLVCAMNPCRCGYYPDRKKCRCSEAEVRQYLSRISKPLLDRMDIIAEAPRVRLEELEQKEAKEDSAAIRKRVIAAWEIQKERYKGLPVLFNSQLEGGRIDRFCALGKEETQLLRSVFDAMDLSARARDRILKVARTIADLDGSDRIRVKHLAEAVSYRAADRKFWN